MVERIENKPIITEVNKTEPVRFSDEAREWLEKEGYLIYTLTGQSIATLKDASRPLSIEKSLGSIIADLINTTGINPFAPFATYKHYGESVVEPVYKSRDWSSFENLSSRLSQVAIAVSELFIPHTDRKTLAQHLDIVSNYSQNLSLRVKDIQAVIGEAPDYLELISNHFDSTKSHLFMRPAGTYTPWKYPSVYTITPIWPYESHELLASITTNVYKTGACRLTIDEKHALVQSVNTAIAPLIVPAETK